MLIHSGRFRAVGPASKDTFGNREAGHFRRDSSLVESLFDGPAVSLLKGAFQMPPQARRSIQFSFDFRASFHNRSAPVSAFDPRVQGVLHQVRQQAP